MMALPTSGYNLLSWVPPEGRQSFAKMQKGSGLGWAACDVFLFSLSCFHLRSELVEAIACGERWVVGGVSEG